MPVVTSTVRVGAVRRMPSVFAGIRPCAREHPTGMTTLRSGARDVYSYLTACAGCNADRWGPCGVYSFGRARAGSDDPRKRRDPSLAGASDSRRATSHATNRRTMAHMILHFRKTSSRSKLSRRGRSRAHGTMSCVPGASLDAVPKPNAGARRLSDPRSWPRTNLPLLTIGGPGAPG